MRKEQKITNRSFYGYKVIGVGYCEMQTLLSYERRAGYNSGAYGWNYDAFLFPEFNIAICTGYRVPNKWQVPSSSYRPLEEKARAISSDYSKSPEEKKKEIEGLLESFLKEFR